MQTTTTAPSFQPDRRPRRRRLVGPLVAALLTVASITAAAPTANAAVSNSAGAYADSKMVCSTWSTPLGFNKSIVLDVNNLRGFDWARVYRYGSNGGSGWVTGTAGGGFWVPAHQIDGLAINPTRFATALIVQYADLTSNGWDYRSEIAFRSDGRGAWC